MEPVTVLAGDVGGTNTRLALFELEGERLRSVAARTYPSREASDLEDLVARFLAEERRPVTRACLGIAGPVRAGRSQAVNLPWEVDAASLARRLGLPTVTLLNDLAATAAGLGLLAPEELATLRAGEPDPHGNRAVVSAGTGLGEAGLAWTGSEHVPVPTEGGHGDFAPIDDTQIELLRFLRKEQGRVSVERVLSGPGLDATYRFLRDTGRAEEPPWLAAEVAGADGPAAISRAGLEGRAPIAVQALDIFVTIYGAEAGNLALRLLATGGVYLGGGIAPRILPKLREPRFLAAFDAKGRLRPLMARVPVHVVLSEDVALRGAAAQALRGDRRP